jgi:hypothetical protein
MLCRQYKATQRTKQIHQVVHRDRRGCACAHSQFRWSRRQLLGEGQSLVGGDGIRPFDLSFGKSIEQRSVNVVTRITVAVHVDEFEYGVIDVRRDCCDEGNVAWNKTLY